MSQYPKSPFKFGRVVVGDAFTNRTAELKRLESNIKNNIHTILISPRRWGKSSLVKQAALKLTPENKTIKFCFLDLFKIRDEEDFYNSYATAVMRAVSSRAEEWVTLAKSFFGRLAPRITMGTDPGGDFALDFDLKETKQNYTDILDLPEKIAAKKNIELIICIDEFQNLGNFSEPLLFQKRLRSLWQHHEHVTYILYGSKRHMLMHLFESRSMPFYKFGEIIYLEKIEGKNLELFIIDCFSRTGKEIDGAHAEQIVARVKRHPYFTQQLAHLTWLGTPPGGSVTTVVVEQAVEDLIDQNSPLFRREIEQLGTTQVNCLKALCAGVEHLGARAVIRQYHLNSTANVSKALHALEKKEIIDRFGKRPHFIDPVFQLWFEREMMK